MTPENLAEIDQHLAAAGDALTAMDDYGLKANAEWLDPLVAGQIAAKKLRAEVERLHEARESAVRAWSQEREAHDATTAELREVKAEVERLQTEWDSLNNARIDAKTEAHEAAEEVERLRRELADLRDHRQGQLDRTWQMIREFEALPGDVPIPVSAIRRRVEGRHE